MKKIVFYVFLLLFVLTIKDINAQFNSQVNDRFKGNWSTKYDDFSVPNRYLTDIKLKDNNNDLIDSETILSFKREKESREIWGSGNRIETVFDKNYLPTFFKRILVLDTLKIKKGFIKWTFTGNEGGVTVQVTKDSIHLYQRYYNSFGLLNVKKDSLVKNYRHPNKIWMVSATKYSGKLKDLSIETDHKFQIVLKANGREIARQGTRIDVHRQQIQFINTKYVVGSIYAPKKKKITIKLLENKRYQTIIGFGGISSIPAYNTLSLKGKENFWKLVTEYNLLIQREYPNGQMLKKDFSNWDDITYASPHYYGDNFPNGEISDFDYNKKIIELGGFITFSFWKLPSFMINKDGTVNVKLYTNAIINYCRTLQNKTGHLPYLVGVQNEIRKTQREWKKMTLELRKALDVNKMKSVKIMMFNSPYLNEAFTAVDDFKAETKVWDKIDFAASNMYDYNSILRNPDDYDDLMKKFKKKIDNKKFISSELAVNWSDYHAKTYRTAFSMAMLYHKNLTLLDAVSLQYCWTLLNTPHRAYNVTRTLLTIDEKNGFIPIEEGYMLRTFGSYSRNIRKGAVRIGAIASDPDILVSCFENANSSKVMVLVNKSTTPAELIIPKNFTIQETVNWYQANEIKKIKQNPTILPGEIITLIETK